MPMAFRIYFGGIFLLFLALGLMIYDGYNQNSKCEDAGGVYVGHHVCINPVAIIEVE